MRRWPSGSQSTAHDADNDWIEREAPLDLVQALIETDGRGARLVDCLTLWLSNLLLAERNWSKELYAAGGRTAQRAQPGRHGHQRGRARHRA